MWPWEHVAFGYLLYSLAARGTLGRRPTGEEVAVALLAAVLPDLVDKPLSWGLDVFPTGYAVAHSAFVAVPLGVFAVAVAARAGRREFGVAFLVGFWSHLLGDVLNPLRAGGPVAVEPVLWPVVEGPGYSRELGLARGVVYLDQFVRELPTVDPTSLAALYLLLPVLALAVWYADGLPGVGGIRRLVGTARRV